MLEVLKESIELIKQLPDMAAWILVGLLFYKVVVIGSWFGLLRLVIIKGHDAITRPRTVTHTWEIKDICIEDASGNLKSVLQKLIRRDKALSYIHRQDVEWLDSAIKEKRERDAQSTHKS